MRPFFALAAAAFLLALPGAARADTLSYTAVGATQYWDVPAGVTQATFDLWGAQGGGGGGGNGAHVRVTLPVTPGERFYLLVGARGGLATTGFNGGGSGGSGDRSAHGYGGGGATDIRRGGTGLVNRLSIAAGGGGTGGGVYGRAGGASGADASPDDCAGKAATSGAGGAAGVPACGNKGSAGTLGAGGAGQSLYSNCKDGGGGGGGLYGGGGGGGDCTSYDGSGGGGGSSMIARSDLFVAGGDRQEGVRVGDGEVTVAFTPAPAAPGPAPGGSPAAPRDTVAPVLGGLRLSRSSFAAATSGASASARRKAKVGTTVSYSLSEAGRVVFTVQRRTTGRKVGRSCSASKKSNRKKPRCTRWVALRGSFGVAGKVGANAFTFRGRLGGKALRVGDYRLVGVAADTAGNRSAAVDRAFSIVR